MPYTPTMQLHALPSFCHAFQKGKLGLFALDRTEPGGPHTKQPPSGYAPAQPAQLGEKTSYRWFGRCSISRSSRWAAELHCQIPKDFFKELSCLRQSTI